MFWCFFICVGVSQLIQGQKVLPARNILLGCCESISQEALALTERQQKQDVMTYSTVYLSGCAATSCWRLYSVSAAENCRSNPTLQTGWNDSVGFLCQIKNTHCTFFLKSVWSQKQTNTEQTSLSADTLRKFAFSYTSQCKTSHYVVMWPNKVLSFSSSHSQLHTSNTSHFCLQCFLRSYVLWAHFFSWFLLFHILTQGTGSTSTQDARRVVLWFYCHMLPSSSWSSFQALVRCNSWYYLFFHPVHSQTHNEWHKYHCTTWVYSALCTSVQTLRVLTKHRWIAPEQFGIYFSRIITNTHFFFLSKHS